MTPEEVKQFVRINEGMIPGFICPVCQAVYTEQMCIDQGWCWACRDFTRVKVPA
jgi:hypothetical protein